MKKYEDLKPEERGWVYLKDEYLYTEWRYNYDRPRIYNGTGKLTFLSFCTIPIVCVDEPAKLSEAFKVYLSVIEDKKRADREWELE